MQQLPAARLHRHRWTNTPLHSTDWAALAWLNRLSRGTYDAAATSGEQLTGEAPPVSYPPPCCPCPYHCASVLSGSQSTATHMDAGLPIIFQILSLLYPASYASTTVLVYCWVSTWCAAQADTQAEHLNCCSALLPYNIWLFTPKCYCGLLLGRSAV